MIMSSCRLPPVLSAVRSESLTNRNGRIISNVFARLKDGVTRAQALGDVQRIGSELALAYPENYPVSDGYTVRLQEIDEAFTGRSRTPLFLLLTTSAIVLLIACANVANLSLSRLVLRENELAMRIALGAKRGRIFQQMITENLLFAVLGGAAGIVLAKWGLDALTAYAAAFLPRADEIAINRPVLIFTAAITLVTGLLFGSWPRLPVGSALANTLKDGARNIGGGRSRLRGILIIGQVAISMPLLVGAALATRTLIQLQQVDPGVDTQRVLSANVSLNFTKYNNFEKRLDFWDRSMREINALPGVDSVSVSGSVPLNGLANNPTTFSIEHRDAQPDAASASGFVLVSSEEYFKTVGQSLLRGRFFNSGDTQQAPQVAIINQSLASRYWPREDPVGQRVTFDRGQNWVTIVGVVANARQQIDSEPQDEIHVSVASWECVNRRGDSGANQWCAGRTTSCDSGGAAAG